MSRTTRAFGRRVAAVVGALALTIVGLGGATVAQAADLGNIDSSKTGSLVIHKHETGSQTADGTPDGQTATGGAGVADVTFTAYKITNLDLTTQAAWDGLKNLAVPADACGADYSTPSLGSYTFDGGTASTPTNAQGDTTIGNLPVAAYLVCETNAPSTVKTKAAPFVVTVPFPNNTTNAANGNGEWLYDVNVYPKNTVVLAPSKGVDVNSNGLRTNGQVTFPVTATIPSIASTDSFKHFVISDPLNANFTDGNVSSVKIDGQDVDASYYTVTTGQTVSVGFNKDGLAFLKTKPNSTIEVVFTAKVVSVPEGGNIDNTATLYVDTVPQSTPPENPPATPPGDDPGTPTNKVVTSWGDVKVNKTDADNSKSLQGATFQVYNAADPYAASCDGAVKDGAPISVDGATEFTSDANGVVSIAGLFVDQKKGAPGEDPVTPGRTQRCYVLVETAAPAGYVLPANADKPITVKAGLTAAGSYDLTVPNTKQDVPRLPLTGANGRLLLMALGVILVAVAGGSALVVRSRRAHEQD